VHGPALPCLAMCAINAYLGLYHLLLALCRPKVREQLPFALLCFAVAAYDALCVGLYSASSVDEGVAWQRLQCPAVVLIAMMTIWFVACLTGTEHRRGIRWSLVWFAFLAPLAFVRGDGLVVAPDVPAIKPIVWGHTTLITYYECDLGPIFLLVIVSAFASYIYLVHVLFSCYRHTRSRNLLAILVGNVAYFIGVVNDSLVGAGVYAALYISEYVFLILTLSMAYALLRKFVALHTDVEALNVNLEHTVAERTAALEQSLALQRATQNRLIEASRRSGMADVATDVLHNVGNALNSVNVSVGVLENAVRQSRLPGFSRVIGLIGEHRDDLAGFLAADARATRLPEYLIASTVQLEQERSALADEIASLRAHVEHINAVVGTQQSHTRTQAIREQTQLAAVLDEALGASLLRHDAPGVVLERAYEPVPDVEIDRHKLVQVLSSLLDNAWDALAPATTAYKRIGIALRSVGAHLVAIEIADNGRGIAPEDLTRIFQPGVAAGTGRTAFRLHATACAAGELGGTLVADSDGPERGARFTLTLPLRAAEPSTAEPLAAAGPGG
jgi:signal transduction histidine kinase